MNIYLAGADPVRVRKVRARVANLRHLVTSRPPARGPADPEGRLAVSCAQAMTALFAIRSCDLFIILTGDGDHGDGGRCHAEYGIALGAGKRVVICGPRPCLFYAIPPVMRFTADDDLVRWLAGVRDRDQLGEDIAGWMAARGA